MTPTQHERLERIRAAVSPDLRAEIDLLVDGLVHGREAAAVKIADDLPYRIAEEMGLGLTFRSCACGQLPCARLRPIREALEAVGRNAATAMRSARVEKVRERALKWQRASNDYNDSDGFKYCLIAKAAAANELAKDLEKVK